MEAKLTYSEAFEQLQLLVNELENGEISVDLLAQKVQTASELIKICKEKLVSTELEVNKVLQELGQNSKDPTQKQSDV